MRLQWVGFLFLALGMAAQAQAQTRYVTDRTQVELRRGPVTVDPEWKIRALTVHLLHARPQPATEFISRHPRRRG